MTRTWIGAAVLTFACGGVAAGEVCRVTNVRTARVVVQRDVVAVPVAIPLGVPVAVAAPYWYGYSQFASESHSAAHVAANVHESTPAPTGDVAVTDEASASAVVKRCGSCHRGAAAKGGVRLDQLGALDNAARLAAIRAVVTGMMPPADRPRPSSEEIGALVAELSADSAASTALPAKREQDQERQR